MYVRDITRSSRNEFYEKQSSYVEKIYDAINCICHIRNFDMLKKSMMQQIIFVTYLDLCSLLR